MGVEAALIAATTLSGVSTLATGLQARQQGKYEQAQANADADAIEAAGLVEAKRVREIGKRQRGAARAALAGSGVNVDMGTATDLQQEITAAAEQDAMTAILNGSNTGRQLRAEGRMSALRGRQAFGGSLLAAGGDAAYGYSKWKRASAGGVG